VKGVKPAIEAPASAAATRPVARNLTPPFHKNFFRHCLSIGRLVAVPKGEQEEDLSPSKNSYGEGHSNVPDVVAVVLPMKRNFQGYLHEHARYDNEPERHDPDPLRVRLVASGREGREGLPNERHDNGNEQ